MKKVICLALAASVIGGAFAQESEGINPNGFGIRLGAFFPADSALRDDNAILLDFGLEFEFTRPLLRGGETFLSMDLITKDFSENRGRIWALTLGHRVFQGVGDLDRGRTYLFGGLGIGWINRNGSEQGFYVKGGVGMELSGTTFAEAAVTLAGDFDNANPSGVSVSYGWRWR